MTLIAPGAVGVRVLVLVFQLFLVLALRWTKKAGVIVTVVPACLIS
jgi:hypothetical protein